VSDRDRALAALHNFAKPQPKATPPHDPADEPDLNPASGASGFVGMLAKGKFGSGDSHVPSAGKPGEKSAAQTRYALQMARELPPTSPALRTRGGARDQAAASAQAATPAPRPPVRGTKPGSSAYRVILPLMALTALVLLLIGVWAVGAQVYMAMATVEEPSDVGYPLLRWSFAAGENGGYTQASRFLAGAMLAALPVALVLAGAAILIWRRLSRHAGP
jgi:hypothetical protein